MNSTQKENLDSATNRNEANEQVSKNFARNEFIAPGVEAQEPCTVSVIRSTYPLNLSKKFSLTDGKLAKESGGVLIRGHYRREPAGTPQQLADLIQSLETSEALNFGTAGEQPHSLTTKAKPKPGHIARTKDCFNWPTGPGWLMIDYDVPDGETPRTCWEVMAALRHATSGELATVTDGPLDLAPAVTVASGSSHIYHGDECLKGAGGLRWYIKIADARDTGRAGKVLFDRLWLIGYGFHAVGSSGQRLERSVIDGLIYSPERLDFAAGAATVDPLEQRRPAPEVFNNDAQALDTRAALPDLTKAEQSRVKSLKQQSYDAKHAESTAARAHWKDTRTEEQAKAEGVTSLEGKKRIRRALERALTSDVLVGGYALYPQSGERVTAQNLLDDPAKFDGEQFYDPAEPDYNNNPRVAVAILCDGKPRIWSCAHGGRMYYLEPDPAIWLYGWCYVRLVDKFYNWDNGAKASKQAFNLEYGKEIPLNKRGTAKIAPAAEYAAEHGGLPFVDKIVYAPQFGQTFQMEGMNCINSFRPDSLPPAAETLTEADETAIARVDRHLWLLCDEDRKKYHMLRDWMAFCVQNPGRKVRWVPLIKGIEGDGKSRLLDVLATALGGVNISAVGPKVLMSDFNGYAEGNCVVALEEIRMEGHSRFDVVNAVKAQITNDVIEIHRKGVDGYNVLNTTNYIAFTNHADAVPINDTDRRWSPIFTPWDDNAEMEARIGETAEAYFDKLTEAIEHHAPALAYWLRGLAITDAFKPNGRAPDTPERAVMRYQGEDDHVQIVRSTIEHGYPGIGRKIIASGYLNHVLGNVCRDAQEPVPETNRLPAILKRLGWMKYPKSVKWKGSTFRVWFKGRMPEGVSAVRRLLDDTGND